MTFVHPIAWVLLALLAVPVILYLLPMPRKQAVRQFRWYMFGYGAFFAGTAAEIAGLKTLNDIPFQKPWTETYGYRLKNAYRGMVASAEAVIKDVV